MRIVLFITALLFLVATAFVSTTIRSDIQTGIFVTCLAASILMFGQVVILGRQAEILKKLNERP
ncbi:hypothetical protein [Methylobacterium sp. E-016]|uniref:hypothetical protein n=1 Tax=Methylobacterium sp. E-016 TaxID=2836556 RepID=UPI001FB87EFB|nr:hypothetical protein [Methylobacterium sp. E-016]